MHQDFVTVLHSHKDQIIHDWALFLKGVSGENLARCSIDQIEEQICLLLEGYLQVLREGKPTGLRDAVRHIARQCRGMGFSLAGGQCACLTFKDIVRPFLKDVGGGVSAELMNTLESIDRCVGTAVSEFSVFYEEMVNQDIKRLGEMSLTDPLTQLINWGGFHELLKREVARSRRYGAPVSLSLCDIDNFKRMNDTYGHSQGDRVLQRVASAIKGQAREMDIAARYGGDEFALIFPETGKDSAYIVCERHRRIIEALTFEEPLSGERLTISFGVAGCPTDANSPEELAKCADQALYTAKKAGGNCVCLTEKE